MQRVKATQQWPMDMIVMVCEILIDSCLYDINYLSGLVESLAFMDLLFHHIQSGGSNLAHLAIFSLFI